MIADIWSIAETLEIPSPSPPPRTLLIVGERKSGKSTIVQNFLLQGSEIPKSTVALEYKFTRSASDNLAHIYELGGGRLLANLISFPISEETINDLTIVITLDLSIPYKVLDSLLYWFHIVNTRIDELQAKVSKTSKKNKAKDRTFKFIVVANKYDVFANQESENRKWMGRVLRYFCLKNKASLFYYSFNETKLTSAVRQTLSQYLFDEQPRVYDQKDYSMPLQISETHDSFESIGPPPGGKNAENPDEEWKKAFSKSFPRPSKKE